MNQAKVLLEIANNWVERLLARKKEAERHPKSSGTLDQGEGQGARHSTLPPSLTLDMWDPGLPLGVQLISPAYKLFSWSSSHPLAIPKSQVFVVSLPNWLLPNRTNATMTATGTVQGPLPLGAPGSRKATELTTTSTGGTHLRLTPPSLPA